MRFPPDGTQQDSEKGVLLVVPPHGTTFGEFPPDGPKRGAAPARGLTGHTRGPRLRGGRDQGCERVGADLQTI